jgi:hypothetical protein
MALIFTFGIALMLTAPLLRRYHKASYALVGGAVVVIALAPFLMAYPDSREGQAAIESNHRFYLIGSAQEFVETRILGRFLKNDEFGLCGRHALSLQQQIGEILVAATPSQKGFDVAVDGFPTPKRTLVRQ